MSVINTIGRRKTSVARLYMQQGTGNITVNGKSLENYFSTDIKKIVVNQPLVLTEKVGQFDITINVDGGGITGQAEAIRLAISRALVKNAVEEKPIIKKEGFLTRDSRMVERKKPGRKKARKRFQWVKR